jgi:hypothetical protein
MFGSSDKIFNYYSARFFLKLGSARGGPGILYTWYKYTKIPEITLIILKNTRNVWNIGSWIPKNTNSSNMSQLKDLFINKLCLPVAVIVLNSMTQWTQGRSSKRFEWRIVTLYIHMITIVDRSGVSENNTLICHFGHSEGTFHANWCIKLDRKNASFAQL